MPTEPGPFMIQDLLKKYQSINYYYTYFYVMCPCPLPSELPRGVLEDLRQIGLTWTWTHVCFASTLRMLPLEEYFKLSHFWPQRYNTGPHSSIIWLP